MTETRDTLRRQKKLEKKLWEEKERRRRKINARIDRGISVLAILVCIVFAVQENPEAFKDLWQKMQQKQDTIRLKLQGCKIWKRTLWITRRWH